MVPAVGPKAGLPAGSSEAPRAGEGRVAPIFLVGTILWSIAHFCKRIRNGFPLEARPGEAAPALEVDLDAPPRLFFIFNIRFLVTEYN